MKSSKLAPKQMCVFFAQELCFVFGWKCGCLVEVSCIWNRQFWNFLLADFGQKFRFILKKRRLGLQVIFLLFSFYDSRKKCPFEWRIFPFSFMLTSAAVTPPLWLRTPPFHWLRTPYVLPLRTPGGVRNGVREKKKPRLNPSWCALFHDVKFTNLYGQL